MKARARHESVETRGMIAICLRKRLVPLRLRRDDGLRQSAISK